MKLDIMTFAVSVPIPVPIPIPISMPGFKCQDLQMAHCCYHKQIIIKMFCTEKEFRSFNVVLRNITKYHTWKLCLMTNVFSLSYASYSVSLFLAPRTDVTSTLDGYKMGMRDYFPDLQSLLRRGWGQISREQFSLEEFFWGAFFLEGLFSQCFFLGVFFLELTTWWH